jgi:hypothetical protein
VITNEPTTRSACVRALALLLFSAAAVLAQSATDKLPKWRVDPYTKNKPELMQKAGYVSFGPFPFGMIADKVVTSADIDASLEYLQILWIETPHFRIGLDLPAWTIPMDAETRKKIRTELEVLAEFLPGINPKTRKLEPWLRAHLTAWRLEKLYRETQELFGVKDEDFPEDQSKVIVLPDTRYMGYGPYLGMQDKFLVLVFEKEGPFQQYMKNFLGRDSKKPQRWHFTVGHSILYTCATESNDYPLKHDTALHCALAFNVSQNLLDGFRHYSYDMPVWIREGFGHWNNRRVDTHWPNFDQTEGGAIDMRKDDRWDLIARGLVTTGSKFAPFAEVMTWRDFGDIAFNDHVAIWSRMDWMMSQGPEKWQKFLFAVKGRDNPKDWSADQTELVGATREAIQDASGVTPLNIDERWGTWVTETYPTK